MNALVVIETLTPAVYSEPNGIETLIANLEAKVRAVPTDISTPAGRTAIKSLAHQVARSKTALDEMGKDLVADLKKQTGAVDAERKKVRDRLDALRDEVRKPVDDFEAAEKKRCEDHEAAVQAMLALLQFDGEPKFSAVVDRIATLADLYNREWQEFASRAKAIHGTALAGLAAKRDAAIEREEEEAELARLHAEQVAREQQEREDRIAAEAAAKATRDAEVKAAREAQETAARAAEAQRKADQERADAVARAEKAERDAKAASAKASQDKKDAAAKAERDRLAVIETERQRVADVAAAEAAETARRESDKAHRKAINSEALAALVAAGLTIEQGVLAITAIVRGAVPHIRISY
jgi:colicin import membrane protein